jgi:hypothetical protein
LICLALRASEASSLQLADRCRVEFVAGTQPFPEARRDLGASLIGSSKR